jgi:hypothetical protein
LLGASLSDRELGDKFRPSREVFGGGIREDRE